MTSPVRVPLAALRQGFQGHEGLGVVGIPAHPRAFQPCRQRLAGRLGRTAPNLPTLRLELRVLDHLASFTDVVHQPIRRRTAVPQSETPFEQLLPGRLVARVLEDVEYPAGPFLAGGVVVAVGLPPRLVNVLAEVVEVQPQVVQWKALPPNLIADPRRAIDVAHLLISQVQADPACLPAHPPPRLLVVAPRAADQAMLLGLVVVGDDLELLVALIGPRLPRRQGPGSLAPPPPLLFDLPPP